MPAPEDMPLKREASDAGEGVDLDKIPTVKRAKIFTDLMSRNIRAAPRVISKADDLSYLELEELYGIADLATKAHSRGYQATPQDMETFFTMVFDNSWTSAEDSVLPSKLHHIPLTVADVPFELGEPVSYWNDGEEPQVGTLKQGERSWDVLHLIQVTIQSSGLSIVLEIGLAKNLENNHKPESVSIKDFGRIRWSSKERIQKSTENISICVLKDLEEIYRDYNRRRAVEYARHFLHRRSHGHGSNPVAFTYEFANVEHLINAFPILEAGRSKVLEPPILFAPSGATKSLDNPSESMRIG